MKRIIYFIIFGLSILFGLTYISKYDYLIKVVLNKYLTGHKTSYISNYKNFDNHVISPSKIRDPWPKKKVYNTITPPKSLQAFYYDTQTVAFFLIKNDGLYDEEYYINKLA
tara:strand:- start:293 stop:625 length:333 start_codon:yes stop_codon:yes gene_type:complete